MCISYNQRRYRSLFVRLLQRSECLTFRPNTNASCTYYLHLPAGPWEIRVILRILKLLYLSTYDKITFDFYGREDISAQCHKSMPTTSCSLKSTKNVCIEQGISSLQETYATQT